MYCFSTKKNTINMIMNNRNKNSFQQGCGTQYLHGNYHFCVGEIWAPQCEAVEMLFTPMLNIHHRRKIRTRDL
jgi:hypothetical protein